MLGGIFVLRPNLMPLFSRSKGMNTSQKVHPKNLHLALVRKLDPINHPKMPGVMAAILGFILDVTFIKPRIAEIAVSSDGFVLAQPEGHVGAPTYLGRRIDI